MFQFTFIFSDWILIKQIIVFSTLFAVGGSRFSKNSAWNFEWKGGGGGGGGGGGVFGVLSVMHYFNAFCRNVNTITLKKFPHTWWNIQVRENSTSILEFKDIWTDVLLGIIMRSKGGKQHCLPFFWF